MNASAAGSRIEFIDVARLYGMALVFYGHFIEELMLLKTPAAASQYKFVYSFPWSCSLPMAISCFSR